MGILFGIVIGIPVGMTFMVIARIMGWGEGRAAPHSWKGPG